MRVRLLPAVILFLVAEMGLPAPCADGATAASGTLGAAGGPAITYVPGSTMKLEQLIGDLDKETYEPTLSQTVTRYDLEGTDLGNSFEHAGQA